MKQRIILALALAIGGVAVNSAAQTQAPISVYAAGSLREALTVIAREYEATSTAKVALTFGASGLLRERVEKGEPAQVFASADTEHPKRLAQGGAWSEPVVLVRNTLCALTSAAVQTTSATLLDTLLRPDIRLATSTPKADPSGDYAWELFRRAEALRTGAYASLDAKALKLVGAADSPQPPPGRSAYAWLMEQGKADVFLIYCTAAVAAQREVPSLKVLQIPPELQVGAAYGLTVRKDAGLPGTTFAQYLLSAPAQAVFQRFGFGAPNTGAALLAVVGQVRTPLGLTRGDLLALARKEFTETRKLTQDGKESVRAIRFQGLLLRDVLERAGFNPDPRTLRKAIVLVTAKDGYQASFSWGELYNSSLGDGVILVLRQDDDELLESDGLPGLRSLHDLRSGPRHVRWVTQIELILPP